MCFIIAKIPCYSTLNNGKILTDNMETNGVAREAIGCHHPRAKHAGFFILTIKAYGSDSANVYFDAL